MKTLADDIAALSVEEQAFLRQVKDANNHHGALRNLFDADYVQRPATIKEFLMEPDLLGPIAQIKDWDDDSLEANPGLYPFWKHQLAEFFAPDSHFQQWILSLSIGCGKTFTAIVALMYKLYLLLCMRNPQDYLGLARGTPIVFGLFSATQRLANADEYKTLASIMSISPFFRKIAGVKDLGRPHEFLRLPHNIQIALGSRAQNVLGMNLYAALLDEAAFSILAGDSQMENLFDGIYRRLTSRYANSPSPGLLIVSSSRASQSDFVVKHVNKWAAQPDIVKVTRAAIYEVKPFEFPAENTFRVMVGNEITPSRLLRQDELPTPGFQVVEIPDHYQLRHQYEIDLEGSLRDFSNIVVVDESPLIAIREKIAACADPNRQHPFKVQTVLAGVRDEIEIQHYFNYEAVTPRGIKGLKPRINPSHPRFVHIDIGLRNDALGLAMVHLTGTRPVQTFNASGEPEDAEIPLVYVDLALQVRCHAGDQVDLAKIVTFILYLTRFCNYGIAGISFDQFQNAMIMQQLGRLNFEVSNVSVDRNDGPYLTLASIIQSEAISYYDYPILIKELRELQRDVKKRKVDHPATGTEGPKGNEGSKDVADALCGAVYLAGNNKQAYWQPDLPPMTDRDFALRGDTGRNDPNDISWVAGINGARIKVPGVRVMDVFGNRAVTRKP